MSRLHGPTPRQIQAWVRQTLGYPVQQVKHHTKQRGSPPAVMAANCVKRSGDPPAKDSRVTPATAGGSFRTMEIHCRQEKQNIKSDMMFQSCARQTLGAALVPCGWQLVTMSVQRREAFTELSRWQASLSDMQGRCRHGASSFGMVRMLPAGHSVVTVPWNSTGRAASQPLPPKDASSNNVGHSAQQLLHSQPDLRGRLQEPSATLGVRGPAPALQTASRCQPFTTTALTESLEQPHLKRRHQEALTESLKQPHLNRRHQEALTESLKQPHLHRRHQEALCHL